MRVTSTLFAIAAALFASGASAQTVQQISFSPTFQEKVHDELGAYEGDYLSRLVTQRVNAALARRGVVIDASTRIDISIIDAEPNRPTMRQAIARPGLDTFRSISIGGAELRAVLHGPGGQVAEVEHRYYSHNLDDLLGYQPSTWSDARRSINRFAEKVADAYVGLH